MSKSKKDNKFKQTEIGMIPEEWDVKALEELVKFQYGLSESAEEIGEFIYIRITDITPDGFLDKSNLAYINKNKVTEEYVLHVGDVLVARTGATYGKTYLFKENFKATYGGFLIKFLFSNKLDNKFFFQFSRSKIYWNQANNLVGGGAQPQFNANVISKIKIPLPPLPEQRAIAKILSDLDAKIELNQQMNKTLEEIGQAIFKRWFIDFEFPNEEGKPYKSSGGKMVESELGKIPEGWKVGSIYEIAEVIYGAPFNSKLFNKEKVGLPLIRIRDLKDYNPEFYTTENHPKSTIINPGDIIASMDAEFRPYIWLGERSYLNQRLCYFKPKNKVHKHFILNTIRPLLNFFESAKVGTTVIHLGKSDIDTWKITIPDDEISKMYFEIIDPIYNRIVNNSIEIRVLSQLRDSLLPKLMSGKIRVPIEVKT